MSIQARCMRMAKYCAVVFLLVLLTAPSVPVRAEAGSCIIQFTTSAAQVKRGDIFTVVCQVSSSVSFLDVSFEIDYDDSLMQFIKGGSKVSGGYGELTVDSSGNSDETYKKTFSLQFMAQGKGTGMISVKGTPEVVDSDGNEFSTSSNTLSIQVTKKGTASSGGQTNNPGTPSEGGKTQDSELPKTSGHPQEGTDEQDAQKDTENTAEEEPAPETADESPAENPSGYSQDSSSEQMPEETVSPAETKTVDANITGYVLAGIIVVIAIIFICIIFFVL